MYSEVCITQLLDFALLMNLNQNRHKRDSEFSIEATAHGIGSATPERYFCLLGSQMS